VRSGASEVAASLVAESALGEAVAGNRAEAIQRAHKALNISRGKIVRAIAATAMSLAGEEKESLLLADELTRQNPKNTLLTLQMLPVVYAGVELHRGHAERALELLQPVQPYDLGQPLQIIPMTMYSVWVRGQAYLQLKRGEEAAAEFQKFVDNPGLMQNQPTAALAYLGLGRAFAVQGNSIKAKQAYQEFFKLWKDADTDVPVLKEAKTEFATLH
jgi:tetratricopeptide (TPR) repeat protein